MTDADLGRHAWISIALVALVGCGSPNKPHRSLVKSDEPAKPATAKSEREQRAEAALARLPEVKRQLAKLRQLDFNEDVPGLYQSQDDFRAYVSAEVDKLLPAAKAVALADSMLHIGLLTSPIDLRKTVSDAVASQAGAYYDMNQKKFFVVMVPTDAMTLDMFTSHELTHALQDQHFDLEHYQGLDGHELDEDSANARAFVVEGEATFTMFAYAAQMTPHQDGVEIDPLDKAHLAAVKSLLAAGANMTIADYKQQSEATADPTDKDNEIQKATASLDTIPLVIIQPMLDSYLRGALAVVDVYETGGWDAVNALYATPPDSTEQLLHPDTKLVPTRDVPQKVTLATLPGTTEVFSNTMGELEWRIYFMLWNPTPAALATDDPGAKQRTAQIAAVRKANEDAAAGWDGDRWSVVKDKDDNEVGLLATVWDSPKEAKEFEKAYKATIKARFPKKERQVWTKVKGAAVYIVDGGTDPKLINAVVSGTTIQ
jgi:hypothetical protein